MSDTDMARPSDQALSAAPTEPPSVSAHSGDGPSRGDRLTALLEADKACAAYLDGLFEKHGTNRIEATKEEWDQGTDVWGARDAARAALMPTEKDAIRLMNECHTRLKELGWAEPQYCPKDGSDFDVIELGSTGIHKAHYSGEWPTGSWWIADGGDLWPSRPALYRVTERQLAAREEMRRRFAEMRDSDGSPKGGDACGSVHDSACLQASPTISDTQGDA